MLYYAGDGYLLRYVIAPFLVSLFLAAGLTYVLRPLSRRLGILDRPGEHKQHGVPTPTLGGISVFCAFLAGCLASGPPSSSLLVILQAAALLVVVGCCDDIWGVPAKLKLGALFLGTVWMWLHGLHLHAFGWSGLAALLSTFLWVGLISSSFNGVDNADGAAGGLAAISGLTSFVISWVTWQHDLAVVSLVLAGSSLGFLIFNLPNPKATIFLGDGGSLFLGFGLAGITVLGNWTEEGWKSAVVAALLVFVPLFDFLFILITRGLDGRYKTLGDPISMCGRDHSSHRLRHLGLNPKQVLFVLYGAALWAGLLAIGIALKPELLNPQRLFSFVVAIILVGLALKASGLPPGAFPNQER